MKNYLSLIKFSHTIFALPFAMIGFFLAVYLAQEGALTSLTLQKLALVVLCMVFARSAAMAFNRYIDRDIDAKNPKLSSILDWYQKDFKVNGKQDVIGYINQYTSEKINSLLILPNVKYLGKSYWK